MDPRQKILASDPLLTNAEAEWFKDRFEELAASNGFPRKLRPENSDDLARDLDMPHDSLDRSRVLLDV